MRSKAKEGKYLKERASRKTQEAAAKAAGISRRTAIRIEQDPRVKTAMARALEKVGCTEDKIAQTVHEALDATKVISANVVINQGKPSATANEKDGMKPADAMTKDFIDVPDYAVRCKAAELAGKFRGDFIERHEVGEPGEFSSERFEAARKRSVEAMRARRGKG